MRIDARTKRDEETLSARTLAMFVGGNLDSQSQVLVNSGMNPRATGAARLARQNAEPTSHKHNPNGKAQLPGPR